MMAGARLGTWARLPPLLSLLLLLCPGVSEAQGLQACELAWKVTEVKENSLPKEAIANISVPEGQGLHLDESIHQDMFRVEGHQLFLTEAPDYETNQTLMAYLVCKKGQSPVSRLNVLVYVGNVNDNGPVFREPQLTVNVSEDTQVGTVVISEDRLQAEDKDGDTLFYELQGLNPDANNYFALVAVNNPAIKLNQTLDYERNDSMTFHLIARDTQDPNDPGGHNATATVTVSIQQADLRPPWFLPCAFTDGKICINTGYRGSIPIDKVQTEAVTLYPGPLKAIDGDRAIDEEIQYRILYGNTNDTFKIDSKTGSITMTKAVHTNMTFNLGILAEQVINKQRWSTTQVTLQVAVGNANQPVFEKQQYRGTLPSGSGPNVPVRDLADPSSLLILRATDADFQSGYNPAIRYRVLGNDLFDVVQGIVLTRAKLGEAKTFSMKVEALDEMTFDKAETDLEVTVTAGPEGVPVLIEKSKYSQDMAILGGVLGALLLLCLVALGVLLYKQHRSRFQTYFMTKSPDKDPRGIHINPSFLDEESPTWETPPEPEPEKKAMPVDQNETPWDKAKSGPPSPPPTEGDVPQAPSGEEDSESDKEVKSILTKERKPEQNGYKAVWFGEDIGAEVDVVVINDRVGDEEEEEEEEEGEEGEKQQEEEEEIANSIQFTSFRPARDQAGTESNVSHI
ncbi:cadherin-related family member 5 isoform X2 [Ornithorhynchus anatinus]|uniref:Cadherin related family member 5 n=1 Tax=Ornithorhynchus anatinus TaxID=9258 RepID=A0A6I8P1P0_ORNAN|nr:cadherin-related family member 5 isoform X2 [Ornithorhynchus anatinus]